MCRVLSFGWWWVVRASGLVDLASLALVDLVRLALVDLARFALADGLRFALVAALAATGWAGACFAGGCATSLGIGALYTKVQDAAK